MEIFAFFVIARGNPRLLEAYLETASIADSDAQRSVSPLWVRNRGDEVYFNVKYWMLVISAGIVLLPLAFFDFRWMFVISV